MRLVNCTVLFQKFLYKVIRASLVAGLFSGCGQITRSPSLQPLSIPHDPKLPTFHLVIEPVRFLADVTHELSVQLCGYTSGEVFDTDCLAPKTELEMRCLSRLMRGPGTETTELIITGERRFPRFDTPHLTAQLNTALSGIGNFSVAVVRNSDRDNGSNASLSNRKEYRVRAYLTEFYPVAESSEKGFGGIGPLAILTLSSSMKDIRGYVRFDVSVSDMQTNRVVDTFIAAGSLSQSSISKSVLGGVYSRNNIATIVLGEATKAALQNAALQILESLKVEALKK